MKADWVESDELRSGVVPHMTPRKKGARDADILVLLWDVFKTRANEIDNLLDLSLSIVASANDFPQKTELRSALEKALSLIRT